MDKPYNNKLIPRARAMRHQMTPAELQLVVEVDGDSHYSDEALAYDRERTLYLESIGLRVLRFTNTEVLYRLDDVKDAIAKATPPPP